MEKLRSNKTDDFIGIKESLSKKYFQIENNINRKKGGLWLLLTGTSITSVFVHDTGNLIGA